VVGNILTIVSLILIAITVAANSWQAREVARQTRILADTNRGLLAYQVESEMMQITCTFLQYPELHPYFVDGAAVPQDEPIRTRIHVLAEMIVDHMSLVVQNEVLFSEEYSNAWHTYFRDMATSSPAIREYWRERRSWYDPVMKNIMDDAVADQDSDN
jgi:hypothetical protein